MSDILAFFTFRTLILLFSTTFSIMVVMLLLGIITVDDLVVILNLSPESASALKIILDRLHEVSKNILDILSQLLNKLFGWVGLDIDLSKIKVNVDSAGHATNPASDPNALGK